MTDKKYDCLSSLGYRKIFTDEYYPPGIFFGRADSILSRDQSKPMRNGLVMDYKAMFEAMPVELP